MSNAPKRRGRKAGSVTPVTLEIVISTPTAADEKLQWRLESLIEEGTAGEIVAAGATETGLGFRVQFKDGPTGRLGRRAIAASLTKMKAKGKITGASLMTNVVRI